MIIHVVLINTYNTSFIITNLAIIHTFITIASTRVLPVPTRAIITIWITCYIKYTFTISCQIVSTYACQACPICIACLAGNITDFNTCPILKEIPTLAEQKHIVIYTRHRVIWAYLALIIP